MNKKVRNLAREAREKVVADTFLHEAILAYKRSIPFSEFSEYLHDIVALNHHSAWGYAEGTVSFPDWASDPLDEVLADAKKDAIEMVAESLADGARPHITTYRVLLEDPNCPDELLEHREGYVTCRYWPGLHTLKQYLVETEGES